MTIALIVAAAGKKMVIGKDNDLPWHFSSDLKFFKEKTLNHPVVMGRSTYDSIIKRLGKPLPGRKNIVLTRDPELKVEGVTLIHELQEIIKEAKNQSLFIIGGASVYRETIGFADTIFMTHIDQDIEGDAFFPEISEKAWRLNDSKEIEEKGVRLRFCTYQRLPN